MAPDRTVCAVLLTVSVLVNVPAAVPVLVRVIGPARVRLLLPAMVTKLLFKVTALANVDAARAWSVPFRRVSVPPPRAAPLPTWSVPPARSVPPVYVLALGSTSDPAPEPTAVPLGLPAVMPPLPVTVLLRISVAPLLVWTRGSAEPKARVPPMTVLVPEEAARPPLDSVRVKPASPTVAPEANSRAVMVLLPVRTSFP